MSTVCNSKDVVREAQTSERPGKTQLGSMIKALFSGTLLILSVGVFAFLLLFVLMLLI